MKKVVIFGTGGFAQIVYLYLKKIDPSNLQVVAFSANELVIKEKTLFGLSVEPFEHMEKIGIAKF
jgi:shikimate 5-dehydrogenase